jgi:RNase P/RNase MRP subunit p30
MVFDRQLVKEIQLSEKYKQNFVVSSEGLVGKI